MVFQDFLNEISSLPLEQIDEHFRPQYSFFPLDSIDYIGKIETLESDWKKIEEDIIKIPHNQLPIFNKTEEITYYSDESEDCL